MADPKQHTGIAKKPWKKQAVTKTTKASTIKKITENATQSRLLNLPTEVLQMILVDLLGRKFVHIKYLKDPSLETVNDAKSKEIVVVPPGRAAFRHAFCVADQSIGQRTVPSGEAVECFVLSFRKRHEGCACCGRYPKVIAKESWGLLRFDLRVLGACRQLYQEGSYHLLASNTFSFDDSVSLKKFITSLSPAQKRKVAKLHIHATVGSDTILQRNWSTALDWTGALKFSSLRKLRGLQVLQLSLHHHQLGPLNLSRPEVLDLIKKDWQRDTAPFLRFRALPLKQVTVTVDDEEFDRAFLDQLRLTVEEKHHFAQELCNQLKVSDGMRLVAEDAKNERIEALVKSRDTAKIMAESAPARIPELQASLVEAQEIAQASASCDLWPDLREEAGFCYSHDWYVLYADQAEKNLENWCKTAAERMAKYQRAVTRLADFRAKVGVTANGEDETA